MDRDVLLYDVQDGIAQITLNRPDRLNAINGAMADTLRETWAAFETDPRVRVGIVKGAGRAFCAGRDITPGEVDPDVTFQTHQAMPANGLKVFKPIAGVIHISTSGAGSHLS